MRDRAAAGRAIMAALLALSACAQARQYAAAPPAAFGAPVLEEEVFVSFDGARLGLQSWLPADVGADSEPRAVIAAVHGMGDYSEAFFLAGPYWAEHGYATYAFDQRGFGRSPQRGIWPDRDVMMADIAYFVAALRARHPDAEVVLLGHSMGGAAALASLESATPPQVDRLVLLAPAVWGWSQMNLLYQAVLRVASAVAPGWTLTGESLNRWPSDNIEVLRKMGSDPLMVYETRIDAIRGLVDLMEDAWRTTPPGSLPTMILLGEKDEIVPPAVIRRYAGQQAPDACFKTYEHGYHLLERDLQAENVWRDVMTFIEGECPAPEGEPHIPRP